MEDNTELKTFILEFYKRKAFKKRYSKLQFFKYNINFNLMVEYEKHRLFFFHFWNNTCKTWNQQTHKIIIICLLSQWLTQRIESTVEKKISVLCITCNLAFRCMLWIKGEIHFKQTNYWQRRIFNNQTKFWKI